MKLTTVDDMYFDLRYEDYEEEGSCIQFQEYLVLYAAAIMTTK